MMQEEFKKIDQQFEQFQIDLESLMVKHNSNNVPIYELENDVMVRSIISELIKIRAFYQDHFNSTTDLLSQSASLNEYKELSIKLYQVLQKKITPNEAIERIRTHNSYLTMKVVLHDLVNLFCAISWLLPLAGGVVLLPFVVPLLSVSLCGGLALLSSTCCAIYFSCSQIIQDLSTLESTSSITKKGVLECSFFKTLRTLENIDGPNGIAPPPPYVGASRENCLGL